MKFCKKCKATSPDSDSYCNVCGTRLIDIVDRAAPRQPSGGNYKYSAPRMPSIKMPKINVSMPNLDYKRLKFAIGIPIAVLILFFGFSSGYVGASVTAYVSHIESVGDSVGSVLQFSSDNTTEEPIEEVAAEPSCVNVTETKEVNVPYTYTYSYAVLNSGLQQNATGTIPSFNVLIRNDESTSGSFGVKVVFSVPGSTKTVTQTGVIPGASKGNIIVSYGDTPSDTPKVEEWEIIPATEQRFNTETKESVVLQCS